MRACGPGRIRKKKEKHSSVVRTAEQPGQALNIDLCFVPEDHVLAEKLPAVSGSSGHLVVERMDVPGEAPDWPGLVFGQEDLAYEEAMRQYAKATCDRLVRRKNVKIDEQEGAQDWRDKLLARAERYRVRQRRAEEDLSWSKAKTEWQKNSSNLPSFVMGRTPSAKSRLCKGRDRLATVPPATQGNLAATPGRRLGLA